MDPFLNRLATALALGAALLAGALGAWQNLAILTLALRCLVAGALVFAFIRLGGEWAGRSVLRGLAEHELNKAAPARRETGAEAPERKAA